MEQGPGRVVQCQKSQHSAAFSIVPLWEASEQLFPFQSLNRCKCCGRTAVTSHSPGYKERMSSMLVSLAVTSPWELSDRWDNNGFFSVSQLSTWELSPWEQHGWKCSLREATSLQDFMHLLLTTILLLCMNQTF